MRELFVLLAHLVTTLFTALPARWTLCSSGRVTGGEASTASDEPDASSCAKIDAVGSIGLWSVRCLDPTEAPREVRCRFSSLPALRGFTELWCDVSIDGCMRQESAAVLVPRGPTKEVIAAVVEMKRRNPRLGCRKIAEQISHAFGIEIDKDVVRRILAKHYHPNSSGDGVSWLTAIGHAKDSLWSIDLFRCESILLQSYWVMVVIDVFTRRIIGFGVARGDVDGVADFIREVRAWSTMPIVVLSARVEEHDKVEALDAGWRGFVHRCAVPPEPAKSKVPWCGLVTW